MSRPFIVMGDKTSHGGTVISADMDLIGQLQPHTSVRFERVDMQQALAARSAVAASTLAEEYPRDFARIIGLHTYSQSPRRAYDITLTGNWVERGGFRFEEFILTPRREDADHGRTE